MSASTIPLPSAPENTRVGSLPRAVSVPAQSGTGIEVSSPSARHRGRRKDTTEVGLSLRRRCFDGTHDGGFGGLCKIKGHPEQGPATLDNTDSYPNGDYAGVYIPHSAMSGKLIGKVKKLGYNYKGNITPKPGNLSLNVPLDENNNGTTEEYAFIDAAHDAQHCPGKNGHVDIIKDKHCGIFVGSLSTAFYANWAALVAAHPTWKVATDHPPIVIAERTRSEPPAKWKVDHVRFGK